MGEAGYLIQPPVSTHSIQCTAHNAEKQETIQKYNFEYENIFQLKVSPQQTNTF